MLRRLNHLVGIVGASCAKGRLGPNWNSLVQVPRRDLHLLCKPTEFSNEKVTDPGHIWFEANESEIEQGLPKEAIGLRRQLNSGSRLTGRFKGEVMILGHPYKISSVPSLCCYYGNSLIYKFLMSFEKSTKKSLESLLYKPLAKIKKRDNNVMEQSLKKSIV